MKFHVHFLDVGTLVHAEGRRDQEDSPPLSEADDGSRP